MAVAEARDGGQDWRIAISARAELHGHRREAGGEGAIDLKVY
jgi:hypothetical protein